LKAISDSFSAPGILKFREKGFEVFLSILIFFVDKR